MAETAVGADLLQTLQVFTQLAVEPVRQDLRVLAIVDVTLSVQEPRRNLVLRRVLHDRDDTLQLFGGELTSAIVSQNRTPVSEIISKHDRLALSVVAMSSETTNPSH